MTCKIKIGEQNDKHALVDERFYSVLSWYRWRLTRYGYIITSFGCEHMVGNKSRKGTVQLHQMVMNLFHNLPNVCLCDTSYQLLEPKLDIHHINADKLDNR